MGNGKTSRIVNGHDVDPHAMPWQVAIVGKNTVRMHCGGSILCPNFIISAGHCALEKEPAPCRPCKIKGPHPPDRFDILVGEHNLQRPESTRHAIKAIHIHPQYEQTPGNYPKKDYDASIYELLQPIVMRPEAKGIHLPDPSDPALSAGKMMVVSGWGALADLGPTPEILQAVKVPLVADSDCQRAYRVIFKPRIMVCAGFMDTGRADSCSGDSGGMNYSKCNF